MFMSQAIKLRSNGGQALNSSGERLKSAYPTEVLNGVRNKLGGDVYEALAEEELEFCIASLSAIWDLLYRHMASQFPGQPDY